MEIVLLLCLAASLSLAPISPSPPPPQPSKSLSSCLPYPYTFAKMIQSLPHITITNHLVVLLSWRASAHHIFHQLIVTDRNVEVINITLPLACIALGTPSILGRLKEDGYCIHVECVPKNYVSYAMITHAMNIHVHNTIAMVTMYVLMVQGTLYSVTEELHTLSEGSSVSENSEDEPRDSSSLPASRP